jgi:hypothetical protein
MGFSLKKCEHPSCDATFAPRGSGTKKEKRHCSKRCTNAAYRAQNRDEIAAQRAAYYARNRDEIAACRAAHRDEKAARYAKRRAECLALLGGKCVQCGATKDLDFDHREPGTKCFSIAASLTRRWSIIEPELRKCQLLCRPCHIEKTELECPKAARALRAGRRGGAKQGATACSLISIS